MKRLLAISAIVLGTSLPAAATSISVNVLAADGSNYTNILNTFDNVLGEDFESFTEGEVGSELDTAVGTFKTLGGTGTGGTVTDADAGFTTPNTGTQLAIRDGNVYGRTSTTPLFTGDTADDKFLDSNDTWGIKWAVSAGNRLFNELIFIMTDATDVGKTLTISVAGFQTSVVLPGNSLVGSNGKKDGNRQLVHIIFGDYVPTALIKLDYNRQINDGVSVDDIAVSTIPLPAPALMLVAGLGAFAAVRRKRKSA
jgi:hypothetical protein